MVSNDKIVYNVDSGQGLRMTVISSGNLMGGTWDGVKLWDKTYNVYYKKVNLKEHLNQNRQNHNH